LAGALVAAALVVAPLVTTGASATESGLKGEIGVLQPWSSETNKVSYWEDRFSEYDAQCFKHEDGDLNNAHGRVTDGGKTVTLNEFDQSWPGDGWAALIVKGASDWNNVIELPDSGVAYASPETSSGRQSDVSHWIVCKGTTPDDEEEPETEVVTPALEWTPPTCKVAGTLTKTEGVVWASTDSADGTTTTWTASPVEGTVFAEGAQVSWVVPNLAVRTDCEVSAPLTEYGEWKDGAWECGDTTVTQTREVVTTTYSRNDQDELVSTKTTDSETQTRELTAEESEKDCEPTPTPTPTPTETPVVPATPASTDPGALAATGGGISPMFAVAGGAVLFAGIAVVAFAAYRRRHASTE
jgi:hypothetical protein